MDLLVSTANGVVGDEQGLSLVVLVSGREVVVVGWLEEVVREFEADDRRRLWLVYEAQLEARPDARGVVHSRSPRVLVGMTATHVAVGLVQEIREHVYSPVVKDLG